MLLYTATKTFLVLVSDYNFFSEDIFYIITTVFYNIVINFTPASISGCPQVNKHFTTTL